MELMQGGRLSDLIKAKKQQNKEFSDEEAS